MKPSAGFIEREHTADWELEVWAPNFPALLEQAALAIYTVSGVRLASSPRQHRSLRLAAIDREGLLVKFLTELLSLIEQEGLAFDLFTFSLQGTSLQVKMQGAPVLSQDKEIKAVTYHKLSIRDSEDVVRVNIVVDV